MELQINDSNNIIDVDFGRWLQSLIRIKLISSINKDKLIQLDNYFTNDASIRRLYNKLYYTKDLIILAANNLVCSGTKGAITIKIKNNVFVPGYDRLNLSEAIKLINFGNLSVKGCFLFTNVFDYFSDNINQYVRYFYRLWGDKCQ